MAQKKSNREKKSESRVVRVSYRWPEDVERAVMLEAVATGRTKTAVVVRSLRKTLASRFAKLGG